VSSAGSANGTIMAAIEGDPFNGGVAAGQATYTPVPAQPLPGEATHDFVVFTATCADGTSLTITARAVPGTTHMGLGVLDPLTQMPLINAAVLRRPVGATAATWVTDSTGGSGSIVLSAVSTAAASGTFSFSMIPRAGTPATGEKFVAGSFAVTF
jgi:hypothetical protein